MTRNKFNSIIAFAGILTVVFSCNHKAGIGYTENKEAESAANEEHQQGEPGWNEQWFEMKKNAEGIIPSGLQQLWYASSVHSKRAQTDVLLNVKEVGPYNVGGRTRAILIDKANSNHVLVGGISGGLWQSFNHGSSWSAVNDQALAMNISCIDQNPFTPNVIYYGTGEGSGNSADILGAGVFKSTDGGSSFVQLTSTATADFTTCWSIKCSLKDSNTLFVGTGNKGLFRSTDGGASFSKVFTTGNEINDMEMFPDGSIMIAIKGNGIWRSLTGNAGTFIKLSGTIPASGFARIEIASCKTKPNVVYSAFSTPDNGYNGSLLGFYKSTDTGKTWTTQTNPNTVVECGFTWYCLTMAVHNTDENKIYLGSVTAGYSTDGGQNWDAVFNSHSDYHAAALNPNNDNDMIIGNDGGVHQASWNTLPATTKLNNGINITQFYSGTYDPSDMVFMGGCQDNGTNYSANLNKTFTHIFGGDGAYAHIHQQSSDVYYVSYQNGVTYRNGSFRIDNDFIDTRWFIHPYEINYADGDQLYFPTNRGLYRSVNQGDNWTKVISHTTTGRPYCVGVSKDVNPVVYMGGSNGLLYRFDSAKTAAAGKAVNLTTLGPKALKNSFIGCIKVHPTNKNIIYLGLTNYLDSARIYRVERLETGSPEYIPIAGDLPRSLPVNWIEIDPLYDGQVIIAGTDYGLYVTKNGGRNWIKDDRIPNVPVMMVKMRVSDRKLFIYTHGRGAFLADVSNNIVSLPESARAEQSITLYPNPAQSKTHLWIPEQLKGMNSQIVIHNLIGTAVLRQEAILEEELVLNTESLPDGVYLVSVITAGKTYTKKLLKQ